MKLLLVPVLTLASVDAHNDIRLTPCQRDHFSMANVDVNDGLVGPNENTTCSPASRAQQADAPKWDLNWSEQERRYLVEYYFTDDFDQDDVQRAMIRDKLTEWEEKTCVKLVEVGEPVYDYYDDEYDVSKFRLRMVKSGGCWSYVGRWYFDQPISLDNGCEYGSTPLHEVMHAFGFWVCSNERVER